MGSLIGLSNISGVRQELEKLWPTPTPTPTPFGGSLHEGLPDVIGDTSCKNCHAHKNPCCNHHINILFTISAQNKII